MSWSRRRARPASPGPGQVPLVVRVRPMRRASRPFWLQRVPSRSRCGSGTPAAYVDVDQLGFCATTPTDHLLRDLRNLRGTVGKLWFRRSASARRRGPIATRSEAMVYEQALPAATFTWCRLHASRAELARRILSRHARAAAGPSPATRCAVSRSRTCSRSPTGWSQTPRSSNDKVLVCEYRGRRTWRSKTQPTRFSPPAAWPASRWLIGASRMPRLKEWCCGVGWRYGPRCGAHDRVVVGVRSRDGTAGRARSAHVLAVVGRGGRSRVGSGDAVVCVLRGSAAVRGVYLGRVGDGGAGRRR